MATSFPLFLAQEEGHHQSFLLVWFLKLQEVDKKNRVREKLLSLSFFPCVWEVQNEEGEALFYIKAPPHEITRLPFKIAICRAAYRYPKSRIGTWAFCSDTQYLVPHNPNVRFSVFLLGYDTPHISTGTQRICSGTQVEFLKTQELVPPPFVLYSDTQILIPIQNTKSIVLTYLIFQCLFSRLVCKENSRIVFESCRNYLNSLLSYFTWELHNL